MTKPEAIEYLEDYIAPPRIGSKFVGNGLTESVEIAIECVKKQIPKKPKVKEWIAIDDVMYTYHCPCCDIEYNRHYIGSPNCKYCGQAIDWSDNE